MIHFTAKLGIRETEVGSLSSTVIWLIQ